MSLTIKQKARIYWNVKGQAVIALIEFINALHLVHSVDQWGDCSECGQEYPCTTLEMAGEFII